MPKQVQAKWEGVETLKIHYTENCMLSKRNKPTKIDWRTGLHMSYGAFGQTAVTITK